MIDIVERHPEIIARFLDISGTSIVLTADEAYTVIFCNENLLQKLHLPQKPNGLHLSMILSPLEDAPLSLTVSRQGQGLVPQIFRLGSSETLYRCYTHRVRGGYLVLGDKVGLTENEILESMSQLNNELTAMSRELSKKNRELQQANAKIRSLARTDSLTGLANRSFFQERFREALALSARHGPELALLLADLDHFKGINDTYGHDAGDEVLQAFGSLLAAESRTEDLPARFGGEEFIIMMPKTSAAGAQQVDARLRDRLPRIETPSFPGRVTFSAGIAEQTAEDTEESLIKKADNALYQAKRNGRDRCVVSS